ncbi:hypothetical protein FR483_n519R [Paramecium bursaria Chlorella virus FR483]|uniref:Uncharacterized protein n519R n=1 Tax=Paramecium bursaria Chlorella virus FR483 TaxID=399781 RepID=A7J7M3_PBCVF|nr:hypothetical protein FR483_n519R [Paramecium bursaria Chlorella virus FR483]ABT15804.1 hypothetical protein FR483_n519R [Paramecium bursaria Chlorella virus FR483]
MNSTNTNFVGLFSSSSSTFMFCGMISSSSSSDIAILGSKNPGLSSSDIFIITNILNTIGAAKHYFRSG